jgi:hypothetical protein
MKMEAWWSEISRTALFDTDSRATTGLLGLVM